MIDIGVLTSKLQRKTNDCVFDQEVIRESEIYACACAISSTLAITATIYRTCSHMSEHSMCNPKRRSMGGLKCVVDADSIPLPGLYPLTKVG